MKRLLLILSLIINTLNPCSAQSESEQFDLEKEFGITSKLVVMINIDHTESSEFGAGIIFGRQNNQLYIVTAYHILRGSAEAPDIKVFFKDMPTKRYLPGKLLRYDKEGGMDMAVIRVDVPNKEFNLCGLPFNRIGRLSELKRGNQVYALGNPNGNAWTLPVSPDLVSEASKETISFQSSYISKGHSGGALVNASGNLVGMTIADAQPFGRAVNLAAVLTLIKKWEYPVQLDTALGGNRTPLHIAAMNNDSAKVQALLKDCGDPNAVDFHNATPLHYAAGTTNRSLVSILLKAGANPNLLDGDGDLPLQYAINKDGLECVKLLVQGGTKINTRNQNGEAVLHMAITADQVDMALYLISKGADVNVINSTKQTPLYLAAERNQLKVVVALLKSGATFDVATRDNSAYNPLAVAVRNDNIEIVKYLIEKGAKAAPGIFDIPVQHGKFQIIEILLPGLTNKNGKVTYDEGNLIHLASEQSEPEILKLFVNAGVDINELDRRKHTPLYNAIQNNSKAEQSPVEDYLILKGGNVSGASKSDLETLLWHAVNKKRIVPAKLLLAMNVDPNNNGGRAMIYSLLHTAIKNNSEDIVNALIKSGADINEISYGRTPTQSALENNDLAIMKLLVAAGADIDKTGKGGDLAPIEVAAKTGNTAIVETLFKASKITDKANKLLSLAGGEGKNDIVKFLIKNGAENKTQK